MTQSKRWCFTLNNYTSEDEIKLSQVQCSYVVYGREVGESGTPHLQGFITFPKNYRLTGLRKILDRAHWEPARGTSKEASDYCKKDGDFEERGEVPFQGKRTDLDAAIKTLKEKGMRAVTEEHPSVFVKFSRGLRDLALWIGEPYTHHDVRGIWIFGPPGTGKSHWVRERYPSLFLKAQNKWWDGYDGESFVLLDDLDTETLGHYLKIWADRYACTGETKGGTVNLRHTVFAVTSNYHPCELFKDDKMCEAICRRFNIIEKDSYDTVINIEN